VEARAPTRIDLAGGTLDIWPLYLFHPGAMTLNMAIDLHASVSLRPRQGGGHRVVGPGDKRGVLLNLEELRTERGPHALFVHALRRVSPPHGVEISFRTAAPRGAGLAGSSALLTALCGALVRVAGGEIVRRDLVGVLRDIETGLLGVPAGMQDYYPAIWGGVQAVHWEVGGVRREAIPRVSRELEKRLLLVYTGRSRLSGGNNWVITRRHLDGDRRVYRLFQEIRDASRALRAALMERDFAGVGRAMAEDASARTRLFPGVRTPEIVELERLMKRGGAAAVKVCGAGGGGCVVAYGEPDVRDQLAEIVTARGYQALPFKGDGRGLTLRTGG